VLHVMKYRILTVRIFEVMYSNLLKCKSVTAGSSVTG